MQILRRKVLEASRRLPLFHTAHRGRAHAVATLAGAAARWAPPAASGSLAVAPWAATQRRGAKMLGSDVRETWKCNTKKRCELTSLVFYFFFQVSLTVTYSSLWPTLKFKVAFIR
ncbi:unnamed protein product [Miscanthus lutarioriparius]|uniref:Uncharacterized protein n=1 Tax=Miscanthus lutarioriparius TaxID=422564 RepID=A0A811MHG3_9POAL|nr:unnamed protein product [Miscanthus lutarioriparius]